MTTRPSSTESAVAPHRRPATSRVATAFADVATTWERLAGESFYVSSRWLGAVAGELSPESAYVVVADGPGRPVAGLAAYLARPDAYRFLNPPALLVSEDLRAELARHQSPHDRAALASLAARLAPALSGCYPVAVCVSPFGFTSTVVGDLGRREVVRELVDSFDAVASSWGARGRAFLFLSDAQAAALAAPLAERGYGRVTLGARCTLSVRWGSLDEYVESLRKKRRTTVRHELRTFEASGLRVVSGDASLLERARDGIAPLFASLQGKYGHGRDVEEARNTLDWIEERFADVTRVVVVSDGNAAVAFSLLLEVGDTLYGYLTGQTYDSRARESFAHFVAGYYEPIRLAIRRGIKRIDDGTESTEVKALRGYEPRRVSGFVRFDAVAGAEVTALLELIDAAQSARIAACGRHHVFR